MLIYQPKHDHAYLCYTYWPTDLYGSKLIYTDLNYITYGNSDSN